MAETVIIGMKEIHRKYFIDEHGQEIMSIRTLQTLVPEMIEAKCVSRRVININGRRQVRLVAWEPWFSLWRREHFCQKRNKKKTINDKPRHEK